MKNRILELKAERSMLQEDVELLERQLADAKEEKERAEEARSILVLAASKTQNNISNHFSEKVDLAFKMIWANPYTFLPKFEERRGRTECDLWFVRNEKRMRPRFATGGGPKDVASFVLRLAYSRLEGTAPLLALDEPFKNLDVNVLPLAIEMTRYITEEFGLQIVMNTHITKIADQADKTFNVSALGG